MEKIVVVYQYDEEYVCYYDVVVALEYSSVEEFIVHFDEWCEKCINEVEGTQDFPSGYLQVHNHEFCVGSFVFEKDKMKGDRSKNRQYDYTTPEIYTLDDWFTEYSKSLT